MSHDNVKQPHSYVSMCIVPLVSYNRYTYSLYTHVCHTGGRLRSVPCRSLHRLSSLVSSVLALTLLPSLASFCSCTHVLSLTNTHIHTHTRPIHFCLRTFNAGSSIARPEQVGPKDNRQITGCHAVLVRECLYFAQKRKEALDNGQVALRQLLQDGARRFKFAISVWQLC